MSDSKSSYEEEYSDDVQLHDFPWMRVTKKDVSTNTCLGIQKDEKSVDLQGKVSQSQIPQFMNIQPRGRNVKPKGKTKICKFSYNKDTLFGKQISQK